ncbi:MAG TPA: hypothetical protein VN253_28670 [Kofleriaceae bacterium]|nr:hypothetical protein [Kofleriaceae bacterium]
MMDDLAELIAMYDEGAWSRGDLLYQITLFVPDVAVQTIVDQLPDALRDDFVKWLRETYDNEVPADDLVSIKRSDDHERRRSRIEALRAWLRAHPT